MSDRYGSANLRADGGETGARSTDDTDRSKAWVVTLECLADDESTYLYEYHSPVSGKVETPREAIHYALKKAAWTGETACGIDEVRKVDMSEVADGGGR